MAKKIVVIIFSQLLALLSFAQDSATTKKVFGTFHTRNTEINGLSFGIASTMTDERNVITNGLRIETPGIGFISFMGNGFPDAKEPFDLRGHKFSEIINGLNISTGSWCNCRYNGLTIALVGQYGRSGNGFSLAGGWNIIDKQNGLQLSLLANDAYYMKGIQLSGFNFAQEERGLQIGIYNRTDDLVGVQIGFINVNQKRSLPFINWSFD